MWYDLIPLVSFIILGGRCRSCKKNISYLYPFIELTTAILFTCMIIFISPAYWIAYSLLFIALIINLRTDLQEMLIPQITSLWLVPLGWLFAYAGWLPSPISTKHRWFNNGISYSFFNRSCFLFHYKEKRNG